MRSILSAVLAMSWLLLAVALAPAPAAAEGDQWNALYDRIIRIEHELKGMRGGGQTGQQPSGDSSYRLASLEEQVRQLVGQMQEMSARMRSLQAQVQAMGGRKSGSLEPSPFQQQLAEAPQQDYSVERSTESLEPPQYQPQELAEAPINGSQELAPGPQTLGQVTLDGDQGQARAPATAQVAPRSVDGIDSSLLPETVETASLDGNQITGTDGGPDTLYEKAYDSLLGRQFGDAEAGFKTFLSRHSDNPLAGDAQYWLGETYFVQGDYKQAAQSFLKGYKSYPKNRKAPDSLFKLAMSLQKLGQKPQACSTYAQVTKQYPKSASLRNQALKEMQRTGC